MKKTLLIGLAAGTLLSLATACPTTPPPPPAEGEGEGEGEPDTIFARVGGADGVNALITAFIGNVLADTKINGYFSNGSVDPTRLTVCLVKQVTVATGGGGTYPAPGDPADADGCRDMGTIHQDLGISTNDFNDLIADFAAAMVAKGVSADDQAAIAGVLTSDDLKAQIIEDATNDATIYQRVGRKPGLLTALGNGADGHFVARVLGDTTLASFFGATDAARLVTCLERQLAEATGGPEVYADANALVDTALVTGTTVSQCKAMLESHQDLVDDAGAKITNAEFNALVGHLVAELTALGVANTDIAAIGAALAPTCTDIVQVDPEACPAG